MPKNKKKTKNIKKILDKNLEKKYSLEESLPIIKDISFAKFDESVDISIRFNIKKQNHSIKGTVKLPHKTGKKNCFLALVTKEKEKISKELGANYVGMSFVEKIKSGWWDNKINVVISMPSVINELNSIGKILGTKGLMPNPKLETMSNNPEESIKEIQLGKIIFKLDKYGIVHSSIGRKSFSNKILYENIIFFIKKVTNNIPHYLKNIDYIKSIYLSTSMSPSILLDFQNIKNIIL
ncbi:50S ribosomal protein L1 [Blattabacterium cuenoti]|uniref:50S ribosomal protein L1 n=1 Tax=Blattabacterium cuenoti TaxID=1653831 RepID=UPI00163D0654|nr:50S ribosomal protein L1 [Blattabacterium cuenoti]